MFEGLGVWGYRVKDEEASSLGLTEALASPELPF